MLPLPLLDDLIRRAFEEDLLGGDLTSEALFPEDSLAAADAIAKQPLVLSGALVFTRSFTNFDPGVRVEQFVDEGQRVEAGTRLFRVEGRARSLLAGERTALNFLQRLSGTATLTRRFVDLAQGKLRVVDTRKTTPGLRALERLAVRHGGGHNHRDCLGSAVMIKDNHIAQAGSIPRAIELARAHAPHTAKIEIEVTNLEELELALGARADIIMLDNFRDQDLAPAVARAKGRALLEISGNVSLERMPFLAQTGVDVVSVGALTHSAPAADISLRFLPASAIAPRVPSH